MKQNYWIYVLQKNLEPFEKKQYKRNVIKYPHNPKLLKTIFLNIIQGKPRVIRVVPPPSQHDIAHKHDAQRPNTRAYHGPGYRTRG